VSNDNAKGEARMTVKSRGDADLKKLMENTLKVFHAGKKSLE